MRIKKSSLFTLLILTAISLALSVALIFSTRSAGVFSAYAATAEELEQQISDAHNGAFGEGHGGSVTEIGADYFTENGYTLGEGKYCLTDDIELAESVKIEGEVELCLNGCTIDGNGAKAVISMNEGATFTLHDCEGSGKITGATDGEYNKPSGGVYASKGSSFTMYGGEISGNKATDGDHFGCGVYLNNGSFEMYGGKISENSCRMGGGVTLFDNSSFEMYGGEISGNEAYFDGGGVNLANSSFTMHGGEISGNEAHTGGGVKVSNHSTFILRDGKITKNRVTDNEFSGGGGVGVSYGTFEMSGGEITENESAYNSGGVEVNTDGIFKMSGGEITNNKSAAHAGVAYGVKTSVIELSGKPVITGNTLTDGTVQNVYLWTDPVYDKYFTLGELEEGAQIGVTIGYNRKGAPTLSGKLTLSGGGEYAKYFSADEEKRCIWNIDGDLWLKEHELVDSGDGAVPTCTEGAEGDFHCKNDCGYSVSEGVDALGHDYAHGCGNKATCTEDGNNEYFYCLRCENYYLKIGEAAVDYDEKIKLDELGHDFTGEWKKDGDNHWHECSRCETLSDKIAHDWDGGEITKEPTETESGERTYTCNDCKQTKTETVPATGEEGGDPDNPDNPGGGEGGDTPVTPDDPNGGEEGDDPDNPNNPDDPNGGDTPVTPDNPSNPGDGGDEPTNPGGGNENSGDSKNESDKTVDSGSENSGEDGNTDNNNDSDGKKEEGKKKFNLKDYLWWIIVIVILVVIIIILIIVIVVLAKKKKSPYKGYGSIGGSSPYGSYLSDYDDFDDWDDDDDFDDWDDDDDDFDF